MEKIKAGRPLRNFIRLCVKADRPALICGQPGIGKSAMLEQAALELGIRFICRDLSLMEPIDLIGSPKTRRISTVHLPPSFLPTTDKGLLVFEKLDRCERHMRARCLQLFTARQLNDYCLPHGWLPLAVINPPDGDEEASELDRALLSQLAHVEVVPDRDEWLAWARQNEVHADVIKYIASNDAIFDDQLSNPRAWKHVSDVLIAADDKRTAESTVRAVVLSIVGAERGIAFLCARKLGRGPLTVREVLDDYPRHRKLVRLWVKARQFDAVAATLRALELYLDTHPEELGADRASTNFCAFCLDLPRTVVERD